MASGASAAVLKSLRVLFQGGTVAGQTDGQLLDRFVQAQDEAAFAALVERHGPMVLRVCRNRLGDPHDAEDAFQATFLVLARKARSIRQSEAVAGWLFGVAGRVSARARAAGLRRVRAEQKAGVAPDLGIEDRPLETWTELYEELDRLPEKYRLPLILCYLEGLTYAQAAARLRCPARTIQIRLARGRERLRGKLERRGLAPSGAALGSAVSIDIRSSIVPVGLKEATATAISRFMSGEGMAAGGSSAAVLAGEVLRTMFLARTNTLVKLVMLLGLVGAVGWLARPGSATPLPSSRPTAASRPRPADPPQQAPAAARKEETPFRMTGTVRVEGTGEPVAGARVRVDLGTRDLRGDFREAVTDADGRYSIPLPEGNARPLFFDPPPGYWLPDPGKHWKFFAVTPQQPVYRKDYLLRRGTAWTFRLTRGPKKEPVVHGFASTYQVPGDSIISVNARTDSRGEATLTLPDEAGKVGIILSAWDEGRVLLRMEWGHGIRPPWKGCSLEAGPERRIQLIDAAGGTVTIRGPVDVSTVEHPTLVTASLPEVDPGSYGRITGTVIDQEGRPIAGATVTIYFQHRQGGAISARDEHTVRSDAQGRFVLRSIPRTSREDDSRKLSVVVYKDGYAGGDTDVSEFKPDPDGTQVVGPIRLNPGFSLTGRVVDPEGRPVVGALIEPTGTWAESANSHRSGPDGLFTIPNLGRGTIRVNFTFGNLHVAGTYVVDGKPKPIAVQLRPTPERPAAAVARPARPRLLQVGELAPNWIVRGWTDGKERSIVELRGRVVCLDFWKLRSGEMFLPALDRLRHKFEPRGVVFLSITPDGTMDQIRRLYELKKVSLVSAIDVGPEGQVNEGTTAHMYGVWGFPWSFLIDRSGKVAFNSNDPANQGTFAAIVQKHGLEGVKRPTQEQMSQVMEDYLDGAIERALARP